MNDIEMSVRWSVRPSDKRKVTISADEVVASYEPRGSCFRFKEHIEHGKKQKQQNLIGILKEK